MPSDEDFTKLTLDIRKRFSETSVEVTSFPSGMRMLDVVHKGRLFVMHYFSSSGEFGVDEVAPDEGFLNSYQFLSSSFDEAAERLGELLSLRCATYGELTELMRQGQFTQILSQDRARIAAGLAGLMDWYADHPNQDQLDDGDLVYLGAKLAESDYSGIERAIHDWLESSTKPNRYMQACIFLHSLWNNRPLNRPIDQPTVRQLLEAYRGPTLSEEEYHASFLALANSRKHALPAELKEEIGSALRRVLERPITSDIVRGWLQNELREMFPEV